MQAESTHFRGVISLEIPLVLAVGDCRKSHLPTPGIPTSIQSVPGVVPLHPTNRSVQISRIKITFLYQARLSCPNDTTRQGSLGIPRDAPPTSAYSAIYCWYSCTSSDVVLALLRLLFRVEQYSACNFGADRRSTKCFSTSSRQGRFRN
eukprot:3264461-Rhodomonas_salina.4